MCLGCVCVCVGGMVVGVGVEVGGGGGVTLGHIALSGSMSCSKARSSQTTLAIRV